MDNFKTFLEDLASGRPAKKPVSSNLLKQRAKDNEKALKSGFMKMPDYVKKKFNEEDEYKAHYMYKDKNKIWAKTAAEHEKLKKKGYDHDDPNTKKDENLDEAKMKNCGCGQDPCITYGKGGTKEKEMNEISLELMGRHARGAIKQTHQMQKLKDDPKTPSAVKKAASDTIKKRSKGLDKTYFARHESTMDKYNPKISDLRNKEKMKKVGLPAGKGPLVNEDENILEVSDALKTRYIHKAMRDVDTKERASQLADKQGAPASVGKSLSKSTGKRRKGIARARANLERPIKEAKKPVVHSDKPDSLKMVKIKYNKPIKTKVTDIGPGGKEYVRKDFNEEKQKGIDGKVCWKGYKRMGTKKKGGKTVDNCVKVEDFIYDAIENYYLTELSPKTIRSYQKKAGAQYRSLRKTTPSYQDSENAYHQGYTSDKEYFKQHDDRDKMKKRGKGLAMSKGKGVQKEMVSGFRHTDTDVSKKGTLHKSSHITPDRDGGKVADALNKHDRLKTIKKVAQKKNKLKEGAFKRKLTSKQEADRLNDRAHAAIGYKKTSDTGLQKVKGGYERKRTYSPIKEDQIQLMTNLDLDESIANLVKRGVGKVQKAIKDAEKKHGPVDPAKRNIPNPMSGDNIAKRLYGTSQKKRLMK